MFGRPRLFGLPMALAALRSRGYSSGKMDKATSTRTWWPCVSSGITLEAAGVRRRLIS